MGIALPTLSKDRGAHLELSASLLGPLPGGNQLPWQEAGHMVRD